MKIKIKYTALLLTLATALQFSCNKLVEIPASKDQIESTLVFADSTIATTALLGTYYTMGTVHSNIKFISLYTDEYVSTSATTVNIEYANSKVLSTNTNNASLWANLYSVIYQCNSILEGIEASGNLSPLAKKQLAGEARFLRAFAYFYLINLYDYIPLILSTNVDSNKNAVQVNPTQIYAQMISDLNQSKLNLKTAYQGAGHVRANSLCAEALLARISLFQKNWQAAADESAKVISSGTYNTKDVKPEDVFLAGSNESILQLWMINGFLSDATQFIPASATTTPVYTVRDKLYQTFENADLRKSKWIGLNTVSGAGQTTIYPFPAKYKARVANTAKPEFAMALRLAEQYLIRAEALARLNQVPAAVDDLNIIRSRAGLSPLDKTISQEACLLEISVQRRIELFGEWGSRFLDLKRTGQLDETIGSLKPGWKPTAKAFPIPQNEIIYNPKLIQNDGY